MKKKIGFSSFIIFMLTLIVAVPVFAAQGSQSFTVSPGMGNFNTLKRALNVNSGGSITVSLDNVPRGSSIRVVVYNVLSGNEVSYVFTANGQSKTFTNFKTGEYCIRIENAGTGTVSGSIAFTWSGTWGRYLE